ncbi:hypothetical protein WK80_22250 [Burkholderia multivorans]|uniref:DUF6582 domain-containing protein n=1 Tax=Burkholderia multivorans TaxID=87883 RepID=UPI00075AED93|nr:DUF6582 domain-containing protein [Burkholderia multivorans]KVV22314.1 hypothetical protein WK80_22250 [Burkholderia multivorans]MBU9203120.1 hypothetical protein [Burkholderia multivorans]MCA8385359.1 hypothetical protein [Burkholderia multivorans]
MANLDKAARDALPDEHFAVPSKRKLPINDETHTRLAWDMVERTKDLSDDERAEARRNIRRRAKELGIDTSEWHVTASVSFEAMALNVPAVEDHPNRMPFRGVLTRLDQPSDAPPNGSNGKRTLIPKHVAEAALPSLLGMAVDFEPGFEGHDRKRKIGIITGADVVGDAVEIEGFFYAKDFPDECRQIKAEKGALGFSYELDARIRDLDADPWVIDYCVFTGAAVLYKELAAYRTTSLAAKAEQELDMDKKELEDLLASTLKPIADALAAQGKELAELKAGKGASLAGPIIDQVKPHVEACMAAADAMDAAGVGSHPSMGHAAHLRKIARHMAVEAATGKVPHIYTDHSYFDASPEAAAAKKDADAKALAEAVEKAVAPLKQELEAAQTKVKDLQAKAFTDATPPERKTLSPMIMSLLAKGGVTEADFADGKKLSVEQVNKALDAAGVTGTKAIEAKLKLRHDGLMVAASN